MKLTINEMISLYRIKNLLRELNYAHPSEGLHMGRFLRELDKEFATYDEQRVGILEKYSKKDEDGKPVIDDNNCFVIDEEKNEEFSKAIKDLGESEIDIDIREFPIDMFDGAMTSEVLKNYNVKNVDVMMVLEPVLEK